MNYDREYSRYLTGENRNYDRGLIEALREDKMSKCKEDVIEMIDEALNCNGRLGGCQCQVIDDQARLCDGCKIRAALMLSRSCVIQGADELDLLKVRFIGVQEAIEDKLKAVLKEG